MSGDDDDIIIHRVQHQTTTDTASPITVSRADFNTILNAVNAGSLNVLQGGELTTLKSFSS